MTQKNKSEVVRPFSLQKSHSTTSILFYWSLRASSDSVREGNNTRTVGSLGDIFTSVQFSCSVVSDSLWPHGPQHDKPPCPSPTPGVYPNSCPLSQWCHLTTSSSVIPFSSCPQSFPESGSLQMSQLFVSGGQSIGVSASKSVLPMNTQDWSPLGWTGWISLLSKGLSRVFFNTTLQKHQFFCPQLSYSLNLTSIHDHWKNHSLDQMDLCWQSNVSAF